MYLPKVPHFWHLQHEGTGLFTNLRSYWASIVLINIRAKFQLIITTGTCNTRNSTWHFRWVELTSGLSKSKKFLWDSDLWVSINHSSIIFLKKRSIFEELWAWQTDRRTDGQNRDNSVFSFGKCVKKLIIQFFISISPLTVLIGYTLISLIKMYAQTTLAKIFFNTAFTGDGSLIIFLFAPSNLFWKIVDKEKLILLN